MTVTYNNILIPNPSSQDRKQIRNKNKDKKENKVSLLFAILTYSGSKYLLLRENRD